MKKLLVILAVLLLGTINVFSQESLSSIYNSHVQQISKAFTSGKYHDAIALVDNLSMFIKENPAGDNNIYIAIMHIKAMCYVKIENYHAAIELYKHILHIMEFASQEEYPFYSEVLRGLAACYQNIGDYESAIKRYKQFVDISKIVSAESPIRKSAIFNLAKCYESIGKYAVACNLYLDLLELEKPKNRRLDTKYATLLSALARCYNGIGDYQKAINLNKQVLQIRGAVFGEENIYYASSLHALAICYTSIGNYHQAIELYTKTLEIAKAIPEDNDSFYAHIQSNMANCYTCIGSYDLAIDLHNQALETEKVTLGEQHPSYVTTLYNLGGCYEELENYDMAILFYQQAVKKCEIGNVNIYPSYATSLSGLSALYYVSHQYGNILTTWLKLYNFLKSRTMSEFREMTSMQRQMYWATNSNPNIVKLNKLCAKALSDDNQSMGLSYNSLLFSKGVILASDIEFDKVIRESGDTVLLEKFEELRTTRAILNTYYNKPIAERPEGEVERLEARAEVLEKDLLAGSKEYADFTRRLEIEWQDVQAALGNKDVAIEILAAEELIDEDTPPYYAALVLRKGWDAPKFVELCGAEELQAYFDSENGLAMMYREANSRKLYDLIWGKLAEHINEGDNVYFSPGGLLHHVNVELLQDADGRMANEKYNLHRVSSTRELCFEKPKIAHSEAVLYGGLKYDLDSTTMIAQSRAVRPEEEFYAMRGLQLDSLRGKLNYLSASKTEVEKISEQMNQHGIKTTLYVEQVGNEESFKALSGKKTPIIHLATHGFFFKNEEVKVKPFFRMISMDQERPRPDNSLRRSGLAFAGAQKAWDGEEIPKGIDDGVMLAQEIASMDLAGTDLVVLSACETGLGEINSEGVFGLQRAFKKAGVQTLVMSLWKVHDEATALFMQTFYENLLSGKSKRDSFATAQVALREHRDYGKDPAYWAGFIMLD